MDPVQPLQDRDPRRIGPYTTLSRFRGTASTVQYLAQAGGEGTMVVVSLARPGLAPLPAFRHRFAAEARTAERLSGGWVLTPAGSATEGPELWTASAYVPSVTLSEAIALGGPLPERAVRVLGAGLAETLSRVHATGTVLHGLAPETVLLAADGPRLAAFGALGAAARAEAGPDGGLSVRLGYLTPEQLAGEKPGTASDVFVLGLLLAYAATGTTPFADGTAIADAEPELAGVPVELLPLIASCLAKSPADRPTAGSAAAALALEGAAALAKDGWLPERLVTALSAAESAVASLATRQDGRPAAGGAGPEDPPGGAGDPAGRPSGGNGPTDAVPQDESGAGENGPADAVPQDGTGAGRNGPTDAVPQDASGTPAAGKDAPEGARTAADTTGPEDTDPTAPSGHGDAPPGLLLPVAGPSTAAEGPETGGGTATAHVHVPAAGATPALGAVAVRTTGTSTAPLTIPQARTGAEAVPAPAGPAPSRRDLPAAPAATNTAPVPPGGPVRTGLPHGDLHDPHPGGTQTAADGAPGSAAARSGAVPGQVGRPAGPGPDAPKSTLTASVLAARAGAERRALVVGAVAGAAGLIVGGGLGLAVAGGNGESTASVPRPAPALKPLPGVPPAPLWAYQHPGDGSVQAAAWRDRVLVLSDAQQTSGVDLRTGRRLWAQPAAATAHRPVVTGDGLFVIGPTHFVWLSPEDGTVRGRVAAPAHVSAVAAADGAVVWFTGTAGSRTYLFAYDTAAHKESWRAEVPNGRGRNAVPRYQGVAVRPDGVLVRQDSGSLTPQQQKANRGRALFALYDRASGRRLWGKYFGTVHQDATVYGDPSGRLYAVAGSELHAYDTGSDKRLWRAAGAAGEGRVHDGTLYVPTAAHQVYALDTATGTTRWTQPTESGGTGESRMLLSPDGRTALVLDATQVTAFATADGSRLWKFQDAGGRTPVSGYQGVSAGRNAVVWRDRTFYALPLGR